MVTINSIKRGIVIDHIEAGQGARIFNYLGLDKADYTVALIKNAQSKKRGKKDMIKIENVIDFDLTVLGLIDSSITVNIIENEIIIEKIRPRLPLNVEEIIKCKNPRCVTSVERNITHRVALVDEKHGLYRCEYCDEIYHFQEV